MITHGNYISSVVICFFLYLIPILANKQPARKKLMTDNRKIHMQEICRYFYIETA